MSTTISTGDNRIMDGGASAAAATAPTAASTSTIAAARRATSSSAATPPDHNANAATSSNHGSCLKYLHKKFKRVASAVVDDSPEYKIGRMNDATTSAAAVESSTQFMAKVYPGSSGSLPIDKLHITTQYGQDGSSGSGSSSSSSSSNNNSYRRSDPNADGHEQRRCERCAKILIHGELQLWPHDLCANCAIVTPALAGAATVPRDSRYRTDAPVRLTKKCDSGADTKCDEIQIRCHDILDEVKPISRVVANKTQRIKGSHYNSKSDLSEYAAHNASYLPAANYSHNCENCGGMSGRSYCSMCHYHYALLSDGGGDSKVALVNAQRHARTLTLKHSPHSAFERLVYVFLWTLFEA